MMDDLPLHRQQQEEEEEINGDVLETIFSRLSLVHLLSPSRVSKWWRRAVSTSLRHRNPPMPWLLLHTQSTRFPHATTSHAYDPRFHIWIRITRPSIEYVSAIKSSNSSFLYMLSPAKFSFSSDPLNSVWDTVAPPRVWRTDPIVARVGDSVVVAGGVAYFEDDPLAVEVFDLQTRAWCTCESMPANLKDSATSSWLSVATTNQKLIAADKHTGVTHFFDLATRSWSGPFSLKPDSHRPVVSYHIGCSNAGLILIGVSENEDGERIRIWGVGEEDFSCEEIGEMPDEFVCSLKCGSENSSINVRVAGRIVYVYRSEIVVACELTSGGGCRWWIVRNVVARERMIMDNWAFSCSKVGLGELQWAMTMNNWRYEVVD